jgi:nucleoside-diphosphate-sugar epimerase
MRMDLVVNTFVYNAMKTGCVVLHNGGEMWRPLVDIRDVCRAYVAALQAPAEKVSGEIINLVYANHRISELALRIRHTLSKLGISCDVRPDYEVRNLRSCQAANKKIGERLGFTPSISVEEAVVDLVEKIRTGVLRDLENPIFHNIRWVDWLEEAKNKRGYACDVFDLSPQQLTELRQTALGSAQ